MGRIRVLPYRQGSKSAKALATELGGKVLRLNGSTFTPREGDAIINWGNGDPERAHVYPAKFIQPPVAQRNSSNKLLFFQMLEGNEWLPKFWTNKEDIKDEDYPVVCRTVLSGHSGAGVVIADGPDGLVDAPLYVKYLKKKDEYRVHAGRFQEDVTVISVQRKARRLDCANPNWQVRNHSNGFVFVRGECDPPEAVTQAAIEGLRGSGLDFGAVDVIWNEQQQRAYVLEINTAPGLEGQTVKDYGDYFRSIING